MKIGTRSAGTFCATWTIAVALLGLGSVAGGAAEAPCADPKSHQFDFWIGEWEVSNREGGKIVGRNRITWFDNPDGTVRQLWEVSKDGGKSWQVEFDGIYRRSES